MVAWHYQLMDMSLRRLQNMVKDREARCAAIHGRTAFTVSHKFWVVLFSFSSVSMQILISFLIYSVICWLFSNMLFSLHAAASAAKLLQSCPTLCDPIDGSPPGPAILEILQARTLEWVAIPFSDTSK